MSAVNETHNIQLGHQIEQLEASMDAFFVLITTFCIFFMQAGFLLVEAGSVRAQASRSIMLKNICDACFGALGWYFFGYSIFTNSAKFLLNDVSEFVGWFQSYAFAITTCTIVSGGVACRIKFEPYMIFSFIMCAWIYPLAAYWAWNSDGWLADMGYKDFAGSGPVHTIGGTAAFIGTYFLKPRLHRFDDRGEDRNLLKGHSDKMLLLGGMILWFGWFSFNAGSAGGIASEESRTLAIRAVMNTLIASGASGVSAIAISIKMLGRQDIGFVMNAVLGGLVAITAGCAYVDTISACVIGFLSPFISYASSELLKSKLIDDPLDATPVHGVNGIFGVLVVGLCDIEGGLITTGETKLMVAQAVGAAFMFGWTAVHAIIYFGAIGKIFSMRVDPDVELVGVDYYYCDNLEFEDERLDGWAIRCHNEVKHAKRRIRTITMQRAAEEAASNQSSLSSMAHHSSVLKTKGGRKSYYRPTKKILAEEEC